MLRLHPRILLFCIDSIITVGDGPPCPRHDLSTSVLPRPAWEGETEPDLFCPIPLGVAFVDTNAPERSISCAFVFVARFAL
jgi:hypothetical protein